ncbi:MAG: hypothetical protein A3B31_01095 [Candidatus Komeilibacteria bacterium RIFCSPLOWO2_01_FULL_53_11]|uniref:DUF1524 domain-containing protein n=1 Tax=Candidatus Komeilibacteria bacterium RIFCSPLOWO2_01_FULL_53_11 TaxID=1798552 RepID=A0A1G2BQR9_9BACT|nr:MAG: hypothetical protein A3B31_01095 [Candidatus Komeilibacteria bacterium RIFCSPLOWO2_01_FULL_53_11]
MLSVYFYFKEGNHTAHQMRELKKWFWRSSITNRYIGSGYNQNIGPDAEQMQELADHDRSLKLPPVTKPELSEFKGIDLRTGRSTLRNLIKLALWSSKPTFINNQEVKPQDIESQHSMPQYDHFYPSNLLKKGIGEENINNILNLHYLDKPTNVRKYEKLPSVWLEQEIKKLKPTSNAVKKYFKSELLPFESLSDVKKFEKGLFQKRIKSRKEAFEKIYTRFLKQRHRLFLDVLEKMQKGN